MLSLRPKNQETFVEVASTKWGLTDSYPREVMSARSNPPHLPGANRPAPLRLGLTVEEAARAVGVSESSFKRHVQPELRIVRRGRLRIIPVPEIERWLDGNAELAGGDAGTNEVPPAVGATGGMAHGGIAP